MAFDPYHGVGVMPGDYPESGGPLAGAFGPLQGPMRALGLTSIIRDALKDVLYPRSVTPNAGSLFGNANPSHALLNKMNAGVLDSRLRAMSDQVTRSTRYFPTTGILGNAGNMLVSHLEGAGQFRGAHEMALRGAGTFAVPGMLEAATRRRHKLLNDEYMTGGAPNEKFHQLPERARDSLTRARIYNDRAYARGWPDPGRPPLGADPREWRDNLNSRLTRFSYGMTSKNVDRLFGSVLDEATSVDGRSFGGLTLGETGLVTAEYIKAGGNIGGARTNAERADFREARMAERESRWVGAREFEDLKERYRKNPNRPEKGYWGDVVDANKKAARFWVDASSYMSLPGLAKKAYDWWNADDDEAKQDDPEKKLKEAELNKLRGRLDPSVDQATRDVSGLSRTFARLKDLLGVDLPQAMDVLNQAVGGNVAAVYRGRTGILEKQVLNMKNTAAVTGASVGEIAANVGQAGTWASEISGDWRDRRVGLMAGTLATQLSEVTDHRGVNAAAFKQAQLRSVTGAAQSVAARRVSGAYSAWQAQNSNAAEFRGLSSSVKESAMRARFESVVVERARAMGGNVTDLDVLMDVSGQTNANALDALGRTREARQYRAESSFSTKAALDGRYDEVAASRTRTVNAELIRSGLEGLVDAEAFQSAEVVRDAQGNVRDPLEVRREMIRDAAAARGLNMSASDARRVESRLTSALDANAKLWNMDSDADFRQRDLNMKRQGAVEGAVALRTDLMQEFDPQKKGLAGVMSLFARGRKKGDPTLTDAAKAMFGITGTDYDKALTRLYGRTGRKARARQEVYVESLSDTQRRKLDDTMKAGVDALLKGDLSEEEAERVEKDLLMLGTGLGAEDKTDEQLKAAGERVRRTTTAEGRMETAEEAIVGSKYLGLSDVTAAEKLDTLKLTSDQKKRRLAAVAVLERSDDNGELDDLQTTILTEGLAGKDVKRRLEGMKGFSEAFDREAEALGVSAERTPQELMMENLMERLRLVVVEPIVNALPRN